MKKIPLLFPSGRRWSASPLLALTLGLCPVMAEAKLMPLRANLEVVAVANSTELTTAEKVARLREFMASDETRQVAFYHLGVVDAAVARAEGLAIFRADVTPRQTKLWAGHALLTQLWVQDESDGFAEEFSPEFAKYLIAAILDGGEAEFLAKQDGRAPTAVGEYAWLASDFQGYHGIDFAPYRDARLVPVLIRCLDAPDHVYSADQGCVVRGEPGEPSGRNTARQQVPIALGRLGDARAIAPLEDVLFSPEPATATATAGALGDVYLRMNAAEGLARLLEKKEDRAALGRKLLEEDDKGLVWCRLPYAKGMIAAGDDGGVAFLSLKHAGVAPEHLADPNQITHHLQERLKVLQGFKSARVADFVRELLDYEPWRKLVLFTPGSVKAEAMLAATPPADDAAALELCAPRIIETQRMLLACVTENRMTALAGKLEAIAKDSRNESIRRMTEECVKGIGE